MNQIGAGNGILIVMQLTFSSFIIVLIDEMLSKVNNTKDRDMA